MEHKLQNQHRLPQVYLKQFGYKNADGKYFINIFKIGEEFPVEILVKEFSTGINIFDLPFGNYSNRRDFETNCGIIENYYTRIINGLNNHGGIEKKHRDALNHLTASIIGRDEHIRNEISERLTSQSEIDLLVNEITKYTGNREELESYINSLVLKDINFIIGYIINHLVHIFRNFKAIFLKAPTNSYWLSCDSPVYIDNGYYIPSFNSEIYLPLSKNFCLYMFHPDSENAYLRTLTWNKVTQIDFELFDNLTKKLYVDIKNKGRFTYLII